METLRWSIQPKGIQSFGSLRTLLIIVAVVVVIVTSSAFITEGRLGYLEYLIIGVLAVVSVAMTVGMFLETNMFIMGEHRSYSILFSEGYFYYRCGLEEYIILPSAIKALNHTPPKRGLVQIHLELDTTKIYTMETKEVRSIRFTMKESEFEELQDFIENTL